MAAFFPRSASWWSTVLADRPSTRHSKDTRIVCVAYIYTPYLSTDLYI